MDLHTSSYGIIYTEKRKAQKKLQKHQSLYRFSEMTSLVTLEASLDCSASRKALILAESRLKKTVEKYCF